MWKIIALVLAIGAAVGYFKYTQDKMAELNQQIATKEFALKAATQARDAAEQQKKTAEPTKP